MLPNCIDLCTNKNYRNCSTSGISSGASSHSFLSCWNNNEECRFNNSTKRSYDTILGQKDFSKISRHSPLDNDKDYSDSLISRSSFESCASNCSFCSCSEDCFGTCEKQFAEANHSRIIKRNNNIDISNGAAYTKKHTGLRNFPLEKM